MGQSWLGYCTAPTIAWTIAWTIWILLNYCVNFCTQKLCKSSFLKSCWTIAPTIATTIALLFSCMHTCKGKKHGILCFLKWQPWWGLGGPNFQMAAPKQKHSKIFEKWVCSGKSVERLRELGSARQPLVPKWLWVTLNKKSQPLLKVGGPPLN